MAQASGVRPSQNSETQVISISYTAEDIARRAYILYITRGSEHGHDIEDWLEAERQLSLEGNDSQAAKT